MHHPHHFDQHLPVPLESPDADVHLPLRQALDLIYQRGLYHLSIDYAAAPPPPDFTQEERAWMQGIVADGGFASEHA